MAAGRTVPMSRAHLGCRWMLFTAVLVVCALCRAQQTSLSDARLLINSNKIAEAEASTRAYLADHADSPDAHFLLGYVLFRKGEAKQSLAEFTAGARYRRPSASDLKVVASDYVILGGMADAEKWFSEVVKETPDDAEAWYLLGRTKFNETEFKAAIDQFEHALSLRPKYVEAENNIGLSWRELGDLAQAQKAYETAISWQGKSPDDEQPFLNLGTLMADLHRYVEALPSLIRAKAIAPKNPTIREELATVYMAMQKMPEAQSELEEAIAFAPGSTALHFKLGQVYRKLGLSDRAEEQFARCKELGGTHSSSKTPNPLTLNRVQPN